MDSGRRPSFGPKPRFQAPHDLLAGLDRPQVQAVESAHPHPDSDRRPSKASTIRKVIWSFCTDRRLPPGRRFSASFSLEQPPGRAASSFRIASRMRRTTGWPPGPLVSQVSQPAVSPTSQSADRPSVERCPGFRALRRFGNLRYGRLGSLRYEPPRS